MHFDTNSFKSPEEEALDLAIRTRNRLIEGCSTVFALRNCLTIASLIGGQENKEWILLELGGYSKEDKKPYYRQFRGTAVDKYGRITGIEDYSVQYTIHKIESTFASKEKLIIWNSELDTSQELTPDWVQRILSGVQDECLIFLNETIARIRYSGVISSIIDSTKKSVDLELLKLDIGVESELQAIFNKLGSGKSIADWSAVSHSCRRLLKTVADKVFPSNDQPYVDSSGVSHTVKEDDYVNRLLAFLDQKKAKKFSRDHMIYFGKYLDELIELLGKGEHSEINKEEAEQITVHTYLVLAEVIKNFRQQVSEDTKEKQSD